MSTEQESEPDATQPQGEVTTSPDNKHGTDADTDGHEIVGHSVLHDLQQTIDVPRVILHEEDETAPPVMERPAPPQALTGTRDGRYILDGEIARGGMGSVIRGRDVDLGRDLAIKVLLDDHKAKPDVIQRFIEEAQIGGQLQHPGIAPVYELGQFFDQRPFFSMKLVKGETLSKLLSKRRDPAEDRARFIGIFEQVCQTMGYAHARGVIHRDLKPANIMVGAFGEVQVMDWGLAKVLPKEGEADEKKSNSKRGDTTVLRTRRSLGSDAPGLLDDGFGSGSGSGSAETQMGSVMGTPAYMPPEQALGEIDQLNQRSDVFGLGAILCEILTGKPPYTAEDATAVFRLASRSKLEDAFARLDSCGADIELISIAKQCLSTEPNERPKDGRALSDRVSGHMESVETRLRETELSRAQESVRAEEARKRARVTLALAASVILMVCLGGGGYFWLEQKNAERRLASIGKVNELLAEARLYRSNADGIASHTVEDLEKKASELERALEKAADANELIDEATIPASLADTARTLAADLEQQSAKADEVATQAKADRILVDELERIQVEHRSSAVSDRKYTDELYIQAFRDHNFDFKNILVDHLAGIGSRIEDLRLEDIANNRVRFIENNRLRIENGEILLEEIEKPRIEQTVEQIRNSAIREQVITALDHWLSLPVSGGDIGRWKTRKFLVGVLNLSDDSAWRKKLRTAMYVIGDIAGPKQQAEQTVLKLIKTDEARKQSAAFTAWLGTKLNGAREYELAAEYLGDAVVRFPGDFWVNYELTRSLQNIEERSDANLLAASRATLAIRPESRIAWQAFCESLIVLEQKDDAIEMLRRGIEAFPDSAELRSLLGSLRVDDSELELAVPLLRKSVELQPTERKYHIQLGEFYRREGRISEAASVFRNALRVYPSDLNFHHQLGLCLEEMERYEESAACYRMAMMRSSMPYGRDESVESLSKSRLDAIASRVTPDFDITAYVTAIDLGEDEAGLQQSLAGFFLERGELSEAVRFIHRAIELDPSNADRLGYALGRKSNELIKQREWAGAERFLRKAGEIATDERLVLNVHNALGSLLAGQGKRAEAVSQYEIAMKIDPKNPLPHSGLGFMYFWHNHRYGGKCEPHKAIVEFKRALELDPTSNHTHTYLDMLCQIYRHLGDWGEVKKYFRRWKELFPNDSERARFVAQMPTSREFDPEVNETVEAIRKYMDDYEEELPSKYLGICFYRSEKYEEAIEVLARTVESKDAYRPVAYTLFTAMSHKKLNHTEDAAEWYGKALSWKDQNSDVLDEAEPNTADDDLKQFFAEAEELFSEDEAAVSEDTK